MSKENSMRCIIGNGKVASIIRRPGDIVLGHEQVEVIDPDSIYAALAHLPRETTVINTAAKINLEWCEANQGEARLVNVVGAANVFRVAKALGMGMVQVSSGCIFDGGTSNRVFFEQDVPTPACYYARTKAEADLWLLAQGYPRLTIVRPRQLFSSKDNPTNLISKFARMKSGRFITSPQSATCIEDLGDMIDHLVKNRCFGVYNAVNSGTITPYSMATMIRDAIAPGLSVEPVDYEEYVKTLQVRRVNTLLITTRLENTGFNPRDVNEAFRECLSAWSK